MLPRSSALFIIVLIILNVSANDLYKSDEEYIDDVINLLLNGNSKEIADSSDDVEGEEPIFAEGIWKCGDCSNVTESKLIYSEVNDVENDVSDDSSMDVQIGLSLPDMKCITVVSNEPGVVRRVSGACSGERVTLSVALAQRFTIRVYNA